jgi:hypothetical protein
LGDVPVQAGKDRKWGEHYRASDYPDPCGRNARSSGAACRTCSAPDGLGGGHPGIGTRSSRRIGHGRWDGTADEPSTRRGVATLPNLELCVEAKGLEPSNLLTASQALYQLSYAPKRPTRIPGTPKARIPRTGRRSFDSA